MPAGHRAEPPLVPAALERRDAVGLRGVQAGPGRTSRRASPRRPARTEPVLVSIFLDGGIDSLSVLAPSATAIYRTLRPRLALAAGAARAFAEDPRLRWNPPRRRSPTCTARAR